MILILSLRLKELWLISIWYDDKEVLQNLKDGKTWFYMTDIYKKIGKYDIWEINVPLDVWLEWTYPSYVSICDSNTKKCLESSLEWVDTKEEYTYLHIDTNKRFIWVNWKKYTLMWKEYVYPKVFEDLKIFWIFMEDISFYSLNELKDLHEGQQEILLKLRERPRFRYK